MRCPQLPSAFAAQLKPFALPSVGSNRGVAQPHDAQGPAPVKAWYARLVKAQYIPYKQSELIRNYG